jgi:uncharacterized membrane protein
MQLTPLIAVHMTAAIGAAVIGPFALWARMGSTQRPWLHRAMGYAYTTLLPSRYLGNLIWRDWLRWL